MEESPPKDHPHAASHSEVGPAVDIVWSPKNVQKYGSAVEQFPAQNIRYHLFPTWRSQAGNLFLFALTSIITISASNWVSWTVLKISLLQIYGTSYRLHLPILIFLPALILIKILVRLYDAEYVIDGRGVEAQVGNLSNMLRQPRLRFEDIRGVEPSQTILERMLAIGHLEIGSAAKEDVDILMEGITDPRGVQLFLSEEIERSLRRITQSSLSGASLSGASLSGASLSGAGLGGSTSGSVNSAIASTILRGD